MRIIGGTLRGKKLSTLEGLATRPTLDRVKESVFNIIQFNIRDKVVLDLFGGCGALGLEALSRDAKKAIFCDKSKDAINVINKNIIDTNFQDKSYVINKDYLDTLKELKDKKEKFDIIFLDPPYDTDYGKKAIDKIIEYDLLSNDGIIIFETDDEKKENDIILNKNIKIYDKRRYGIAYIMFIRKG